MKEKNLKKEIRKEKINNIKKFLSDKRNKALVKLALWFIFFLIVVVYVRFLNDRRSNYISNEQPIEKFSENITDAVKLLKDKNRYEFTFEYKIVTDVQNIYTVSGKKYDDKYLMEYNNDTYYYDKELYIINENNKELLNSDMIYSLFNFNANNIYKYLLNSKYEYKQENANGTIKIRSNLNIHDFDNSVDSDDLIYIETLEKDNELISINIDLSNYYKFKDDIYSEYKVELIYKNFDNVQDFNYN